MIIPGGTISKQSRLLSTANSDTQSTSNLSTTSSDQHLDSLLGQPPGYTEFRRPGTRVSYTFTPHPTIPNSMLMSPPPYLEKTHPSYYIAVNLNCFSPFSYITTIRRGGWDGELVGDFELGFTSAKKQGSVCIYGHEYSLSEILETNSKMFRAGTYHWKGKTSLDAPPTIDLFWEESSSSSGSVMSCYLGKEKAVTNHIATFTPNNIPRRPNRNPGLTRLEVMPAGHDQLDEVVVSALLIERIRTSPSALKDLPVSMLKEFF